jgi:hypothetical protein
MENWESRIQGARDAIDAASAQGDPVDAPDLALVALAELVDVVEACAEKLFPNTHFDRGHAC